MRKIHVFNFISLDGYYKGPNEDISWHAHDAEGNEHAGNMLQFESTLLFGRITYEMMSEYWPIEMAAEQNPGVAKGMNKVPKIVFSNTLKKATWENTSIVKGDLIEEVKKLKQQPGNDMTILGSGSIVTQLAEAGLIDEYQFMLDPVALGKGTPIFKKIKDALHLNFKSVKAFKNGSVLLIYTS